MVCHIIITINYNTESFITHLHPTQKTHSMTSAAMLPNYRFAQNETQNLIDLANAMANFCIFRATLAGYPTGIYPSALELAGLGGNLADIAVGLGSDAVTPEFAWTLMNEIWGNTYPRQYRSTDEINVSFIRWVQIGMPPAPT